MKRSILAIAIVLGVGVTQVIAHGGATGVVRERMDMMVVMDKAMKSLLAAMWSEAYDADEVSQLAESIAEHAGEALTVKFPEGTHHTPSEAKENIWQDWEVFTKLAGETQRLGGALSTAAGNERLPPDRRADVMSSVQGIGPAVELPSPNELSDSELAALAPEVLFALLDQTCTGCHRDYRE